MKTATRRVRRTGGFLATVALVVSGGLLAAPWALAASCTDEGAVVVSRPNPYPDPSAYEQAALLGPFARLLTQIYLSLPEETQQKVEAAPKGFVVEVKWEDLTDEQRQEWVNIAVAYDLWESASQLWHWEFDGIVGASLRFWYDHRDPGTGMATLAAQYEVQAWDSSRGAAAGELRHTGLGFTLPHGLPAAAQPRNYHTGTSRQPGSLTQPGVLVLADDPNPYPKPNTVEQRALTGPFVRLLRSIYHSLPEDTQKQVEAAPMAFVAELKWADLTQEQRREWVNIAVAYNSFEKWDGLWRWDFDGVTDGSVRFWYAHSETAEDADRSLRTLQAAYEFQVWDSRRRAPAGELRHAGVLFTVFEGTLVVPQGDNPYLTVSEQELARAHLQLRRDIYWSIPEEKRKGAERGGPPKVLVVGWEELTSEQRQRWANLKAAQYELDQRSRPQLPGLPEPLFPSGFPGVIGGYISFWWAQQPGGGRGMWYSRWTVAVDPVSGLPGWGLGGAAPFEPGPYS